MKTILKRVVKINEDFVVLTVNKSWESKNREYQLMGVSDTNTHLHINLKNGSGSVTIPLHELSEVGCYV